MAGMAYHTVEDGPWPPAGIGVASANGVVELGGLTEGVSYTAFGSSGVQEFVASNQEDRLQLLEGGTPISVTASPYNVLPGVTDAAATTAGINQAILAASTRTDGPRAVHFPPGTYSVDLVQDPDGSTIAAGVWNRTGVALLAAPGVTIKLKDAATMPVGCTQAHIVSVLAPFTTISGKLKRDLFIDHLTIDGNAANQTTPVCRGLRMACSSAPQRRRGSTVAS
jgi:hypothetical protein